ncbi:MAG: ABC transporter permease [Lachnospiraceae bacterium]|nr:ABC transporter permease [Lachnospiraceae bacterium]
MSSNKNQIKKVKFHVGKTEIFLLAVLALLFIIFAVATPVFFRFSNIMNLLRQTSIYGIVALGMVFVIISSGIDLSVGSVLGFSGTVVALMVTNNISIPVAIILAILACAAIGAMNGVLIYDGNVPPFIATMGMMSLVRATLMLMTNARMISGLPENFLAIARFNPLGIPLLAIVWILLSLIALFIARKTVFGRNVYAYGSNKEAARLSGIHIRLTVYGTYIFSAVMCAIAGILITSRLSNAAPTTGTGYELDAIAASVVGGASLNGGQGSVIGAFLGAIIMSTLRQGGTLLGVNSFIMEIIIALLIIAAVLLDQIQRKRGGKKS